MHRLMLLRHAKSDRPSGVRDHERPLAERGEADAREMGDFIERCRLHPDMVLVSSARRTHDTWRIVERRLSRAPLARSEPRIYEAGASQLLALARALPPESGGVMLVGHNPGLHELALTLAGSGEPKALEALRSGLPTSALAVIDFDAGEWSDIGPGTGRLVLLASPSMLRDRPPQPR